MQWNIRKLWARFTKKRAVLYQDIYTCPIRVFQLCEEDNNYKYLVKTGVYLNGHDLKVTYINLQKQVIDNFGVDKSYERIFWLQYSILKLQIEELLTSKNNTTQINIKLRELNEIKVKEKVEDIRKINASNHRELTKWSGRNSKKLTVYEYYNDFFDMKRELEKMEHDNIFKVKK